MHKRKLLVNKNSCCASCIGFLTQYKCLKCMMQHPAPEIPTSLHQHFTFLDLPRCQEQLHQLNVIPCICSIYIYQQLGPFIQQPPPTAVKTVQTVGLLTCLPCREVQRWYNGYGHWAVNVMWAVGWIMWHVEGGPPAFLLSLSPKIIFYPQKDFVPDAITLSDKSSIYSHYFYRIKSPPHKIL